MKHKIIFLIFILIISGSIFAQNTNKPEDEILFGTYETMPQFPGGESALNDFLNKNLRNPSKGNGRVVVQFTITEEGKVVEPEVIRSISPELDSEALRVVKLMPLWKPGKQRDKIVKVKYTLPFNFRSSLVLSEENSEKNDKPKDEVLFGTYETWAQFPGGDKALTDFINKNLRNPSKANGRVIVQFWITEEGKIVEPEVVRSVSPELDSEAMRLINLMPLWKPGTSRGKIVKSKYTLPFNFRYPEVHLTDMPEYGVVLRAASERIPYFPGGNNALQDFICKNIRNPSKSPGRVIVQFTVTEEGKAVEPEIVTSVSPEFDSEAIRLINSMPLWEPGKVRGKAVMAQFKLPINFKSSLEFSEENSAKIVENIIIEMEQSVISTDFFFRSAGENAYSTSGKIILKDEKFMVEMYEMKVWFDGKTMWSYSPQINEVSITEPDKKQLETINPLLFIKTINNPLTKTYVRERNRVIVFTPTTDIADFKRVELVIEKSTNDLTQIDIYGENNSRTIFDLSNYKIEDNIADSYFTFDKSKYKGVYVIDLR